MSDVPVQSAEPPPHATRARMRVPSPVIGMIIFVFTEVMFFSALISAYLIIKAGAPMGTWPPPDQPTLPVAMTGFNTIVLLLSGVMMFLSGRAYAASNKTRSVRLLFAATLLGLFFVLVQGYEWVNLIKHGLTLYAPDIKLATGGMTASSYGSFFYLIIGTHALHALAAIIYMIRAYSAFQSDRLGRGEFQALSIFWYFVVGVWPVLYALVYLS